MRRRQKRNSDAEPTLSCGSTHRHTSTTWRDPRTTERQSGARTCAKLKPNAPETALPRMRRRKPRIGLAGRHYASAVFTSAWWGLLPAGSLRHSSAILPTYPCQPASFNSLNILFNLLTVDGHDSAHDDQGIPSHQHGYSCAHVADVALQRFSAPIR